MGWTIYATALSWIVGGELPDGDIELGRIQEGTVALRGVSQPDQDRWRESRRSLMRGHGALGDSEGLRAYPNVPIPEWLLDCCTVAAEVRADPIQMAGEVEFDARDLHSVLWMAGLHGFDFLSTQAADAVRLIVEPNLQVVCEELLIKVEQGSYTASHHAWSAPSYRQYHARQRFTIDATEAVSTVQAWKSVSQGPNSQLVRFPLRRFGLAAQRPMDEDRLIDAWVGLDGLYKKDTESRGVGINTARRAGVLLGLDTEQRRTLNRTVPDSYILRGDVVHGRSSYTDEQLDTAVAVAQDLLRRSLVAVVEKDQPIDPSVDPPRAGTAMRT